jgi:hypothetical protein
MGIVADARKRLASIAVADSQAAKGVKGGAALFRRLLLQTLVAQLDELFAKFFVSQEAAAVGV